MLFPITTLCVLGCIVAARRHERRSPLTLALYAWTLGLVLGSPLFFAYRVDYSIKADAFIAACLVVITLAYRLVRLPPRTAPRRYADCPQELQMAKVMGVLGVAGCLLLLANARAAGLQFSVSYLLDNLGSIRTERVKALANSTSREAIETLGVLAAPCGVLCILVAVKLGHDAGRRLQALAVINFVLIAAVSLTVFAGRATLVNVALLAFISLYLGRRRVLSFKPRTLLIASVVAFGGWYLATSWLGTREQQTTTIRILEQTQRAELRPWIERLAQRDESIALAMVSVGYFGSPIPTFHFYLGAPTLPGPFYGAYSYPLPGRVLGTINGTWTPEQWFGIRQEIFAPITGRGYFGNVWATWLRDVLVDFGYLGAIFFCGLFGAFMAWARNRSQAIGALHYHFFEVIACFTLGFGAFTSFMFDPFVSYPFFLALAVMFFVPSSPRLSIERRGSPISVKANA